MRFWVGVTAAFGAGLGIGAGLWSVIREEQLKIEYKESTASFIRAMELARAQSPRVVEDVPEEVLKSKDHEVPDYLPTQGIKTTDVQDFKPEPVNPYHVEPEKPEPSWTYLEAEDYHEDDGRYKGQITLLPGDDGKPVFVENDIEINDWEEKIGSSILRDFYALVPPNTVPAVLYVRNNITESDYEVIREIP